MLLLSSESDNLPHDSWPHNKRDGQENDRMHMTLRPRCPQYIHGIGGLQDLQLVPSSYSLHAAGRVKTVVGRLYRSSAFVPFVTVDDRKGKHYDTKASAEFSDVCVMKVVVGDLHQKP